MSGTATLRPETGAVTAGLHYTVDHPTPDPKWAHDTLVRRDDGRGPELLPS